MPLLSSCDALYFPEQPYDNLITLTWQADEHSGGDAELASTHAEANTTLVYKIKSTAPQLFHVKPHYGALLLTDPAAIQTPAAFQTTNVQFALRANYSTNYVDHADGPTPDGARSTAAAGSKFESRSQRFVVDYAVIVREPLAYQQVAQAFHDPSKLTEAVKSIWTLISSGAVARSHVQLRGNVGLKVYMENVFVSTADAQGATHPTMVPQNAKLIPCSITSERASGSVGRGSARSPDTNANESRRGSAGIGGSTRGSQRRPDELRALKEEVNTMRQEARSPNASGRGVTPIAGSGSMLQSVRRNLMSGGGNESGSATGTSSGLMGSGEDVLMHFEPAEHGSASSGGGAGADRKPKKAKGVKLYTLLAIMFALYVLCMIMRRGGGSAKAGIPGVASNSAAAQQLQAAGDAMPAKDL